jgi:hypothetical protein
MRREMYISRTSHIRFAGTGMKTRTVRWTPHPGQHGKTHIASFVSLILTDEFHGARCPLYMRRIHIQIDVESYTTKWLKPELPHAEFDDKLADPSQKPSSDIESGGAGPDIVFSVSAEQEISGLELKCKSNVYDGYEPSIRLVNASVNGVATSGHCTELSCASRAQLAGWAGFGQLSSVASGVGMAAGEKLKQFAFEYTSVTGIDEVRFIASSFFHLPDLLLPRPVPGTAFSSQQPCDVAGHRADG